MDHPGTSFLNTACVHRFLLDMPAVLPAMSFTVIAKHWPAQYCFFLPPSHLPIRASAVPGELSPERPELRQEGSMKSPEELVFSTTLTDCCLNHRKSMSKYKSLWDGGDARQSPVKIPREEGAQICIYEGKGRTGLVTPQSSKSAGIRGHSVALSNQWIEVAQP